MSLGNAYKVRDGSYVSFWRDVWLGETPFKIQFPFIFSISANPKAIVKECFNEGEWYIPLRRSISEKEMLEWEGLLVSLEGLMLEAGRDVMYWKIGKNGKYLAKSLYQELTFRGVKDQRMMEL